jgi:hypothetical protein
MQLQLVSAVLSLGTAAIHVAVIGEHFAEYVPLRVVLRVRCVAPGDLGRRDRPRGHHDDES